MAEKTVPRGAHCEGEFGAVGCLYITKLDDVDPAALEQLVRTGYEYVTTELDVLR